MRQPTPSPFASTRIGRRGVLGTGLAASVTATTALVTTTAPTIAAASTAITAASATSAARLTRTALLAGIARILRLGLRSHGLLGGRGLHRRGFLVVVFVSHHQNSSPPSRAASASALTRPWNR